MTLTTIVSRNDRDQEGDGGGGRWIGWLNCYLAPNDISMLWGQGNQIINYYYKEERDISKLELNGSFSTWLTSCSRTWATFATFPTNFSETRGSRNLVRPGWSLRKSCKAKKLYYRKKNSDKHWNCKPKKNINKTTKNKILLNGNLPQDVFSKNLPLPLTLTQKILDLSLVPLCREVFKVTLPFDNIALFQEILWYITILLIIHKQCSPEKKNSISIIPRDRASRKKGSS